MAAMHSVTHVLSGREFSRKDFKLIKDTIRLCPHLSRKELAKVISENLSWYQSDGEPKYRACLKVLEKLEAWGHIQLPPLRYSFLKGVSPKIKITEQSDAGALLTGRIDEYGAAVIEPVEGEDGMRLWGEYIERYHYLGYKRAFGNQQRYFVRLADGTLVGCLLYSASAWAGACRDEWIGWDRLQRARGSASDHQYVEVPHFSLGKGNKSCQQDFIVVSETGIRGLASEVYLSAGTDRDFCRSRPLPRRMLSRSQLAGYRLYKGAGAHGQVERGTVHNKGGICVSAERIVS